MPLVRTQSVRLGFRVADAALERDVINRTLDDRDYELTLNPAGGPLMVYMPDARPLCCYLPGVLKEVMTEVDAYRILHPLHVMMTNNRGMASGTRRYERGAGGGTRSDAMPVSSVMIGSSDPGSVYRYCRLTEWTGSHLPEYQTLAPMFRVIASHLEERVTERYNIQMEHVRKTDPGWVVPGTPFTSITINNSYPTGVHKDDGDLVDGFSTLACIRRGDYEGGKLVFPQYRVAVDMQDGDLLLMDAHQWHGNTRMTCGCGERILNKFCTHCGAERISIVSYYRTKMADCGSPDEEYDRAVENTEKRSQPRKHEAEELQVQVQSIAPGTGTEIRLPDPAATATSESSIATGEPERVDPVPAEPEKPKRRRTVKAAAPQPESEVEPEQEPAASRTVTRRRATQRAVTPAVKPATEAKPPARRVSRKKTAAESVKAVAVNPETGEPLEG